MHIRLKSFPQSQDVLWLKLREKVGDEITRSLMNYYSSSNAYVLNEDKKSSNFKTTIGIKQGGSLSPKLFAIISKIL